MLELRDIRFARDGDRTYRFDLGVAPGEIVGISGASGAGKSTLLDLIAGFLSPDCGRMSIDTLEFQGLAVEHRPVSILFQENNIFPHLSAAQNVRLGSKGAIDSDQCLNEVGLAEQADQKCASMSGGQQQRVALARTLLLDRPVLLLDEPFSALDDATATRMRNLVKKLVTENQWHTLLVSHHQADFIALADRVLELENGELRAMP